MLQRELADVESEQHATVTVPAVVARVVLAFSVCLLGVEVMLFAFDVPISEAAQNLWPLRTIPYFLFWAPVWFLFTARGRQYLRSNETRKTATFGNVLRISLASVMLGGATFLLILLYYLFAWGENAAVWLGQNLLAVVAAAIALNVPAVIKSVK